VSARPPAREEASTRAQAITAAGRRPRRTPGSFAVRRPLARSEWGTAVGVGVAAGVAAAAVVTYLTSIWLARTTLAPRRGE
jgi:hypothetical protein